ncbi:hypothetical protein EKO27_g3170 [Xylaria grammica]|uniref:DUF7896 domain-containing protein n=1 Tax=Xylaria grammica TaxID=363999 RepID=A0A439DC14_9PEZI|nr:hypothetical protein EKO27_g3170 [Xylaria grammica]
MTEVKASFPESSSVTTFLRANLPGSRFRAKLAAIGKEAKPYHMPRIAETILVTAADTEESKDLATGADAACASSQTETDSGYGTTAFDRDASEATERAKTALTFSRKPVPQQFLNRLLDIRALFAESLLDVTVSAKQRPTKGASMKLKYANHDDSIYLVIQCDKRDKKRMGKFFAQSHVKETIGDDITVHITTGLRQLATQELKVYGESLGIPFPGSMIRIEGNHGSSMATLGGVISVVKEGRIVLYGLTASHALARLVDHSNQPWRDIENESDTTYDSDESCDSSEDGQSEVFPGAHYDRPTGAPLEPAYQIGSITEHSLQSTSSTNHDWALIELHPSQTFSNLVAIQFHSKPDNLAYSCALTFMPLRSTPIQSLVNVIIPTSRGNQRGTLTSSTSSLLVAPGREFVETHDVVMDDGFSLQPGDSGSWVVHEETGEVYGHVVSIDMFGEAYVMPFNHTLRDIQAHLHADHVGLPQQPEKATEIWRSTAQTEEHPELLKKSDVVNQQMTKESRGWSDELPPSTDVLATIIADMEAPLMGSMNHPRSISSDTFDSGYVTDPQQWQLVHQMDNACAPISPPSPSTEGSPARVESKKGKAKSVQLKHQKVFCDQCDDRPEGFRDRHELQRHREAKHPGAVKKFICVHPSINGFKVITPIVHPLEKCRACKERKQYSAYYYAVAHLRRAHFRERPSRPKGKSTAIAAFGRDPRSGPPIQELKGWIKEVWVDSIDPVFPDVKEKSNVIMETKNYEQEETDTEDGIRKINTDNDDGNNRPDTESVVEPVDEVSKPPVPLPPTSYESRVKFSSLPPAWSDIRKQAGARFYDSGIGSSSSEYTSSTSGYDERVVARDRNTNTQSNVDAPRGALSDAIGDDNYWKNRYLMKTNGQIEIRRNVEDLGALNRDARKTANTIHNRLERMEESMERRDLALEVANKRIADLESELSMWRERYGYLRGLYESVKHSTDGSVMPGESEGFGEHLQGHGRRAIPRRQIVNPKPQVANPKLIGRDRLNPSAVQPKTRNVTWGLSANDPVGP